MHGQDSSRFDEPVAECIDENETLATAAEKMRDIHVGALPICGTDDRLQGSLPTATSWSAASPRALTDDRTASHIAPGQADHDRR